MIRISARFFNMSRKENPLVLKLTLAVLGLETLTIGLLYFLNQTYGQLYQAIQDYDPSKIWFSIGVFSALAGVSVLFNGYAGYLINKLAFELRKGLTIASRKSAGSDSLWVECYAQNIQEDLKKFGELSCDFWVSVFKAVLKLVVFISVITSLSHWYIGALVFVSAIAGTVLTKVVSRELIKLQSQQETYEAEFRLTLTHKSFRIIEAQFRKINNQIKKLSFTQSGLGQGFVLLPFILLMPMYIAKSLTMGQFFQSVNALNKIIDSLTVLIDNRQLIVQLESCLLRLNWFKGE